MNSRYLSASVAFGLLAACSGQIPDQGLAGPSQSGSTQTPSTANFGAGTVNGAPTETGTGSVGNSPTAMNSAAGNSEPNSTAGETPDSFMPVLNDDGSVALPMALNGQPIYTRAMRLTNEQWERSVRDLLRLPDLPSRSGLFEGGVEGQTVFLNDELQLSVSNNQWQQYELASEDLAAEVSLSDEALGRLYSGTDSDGFIREFGRRAFRRPLSDDEVTRYQQLFDTGTNLSGGASDFAKGAGIVIEAMLQSPNFLYRMELGEAGTPLDGYELATKLSLFLKGTIPSDALLDKAEAGTITSSTIEAEARAMLDTPETANIFSAFYAELFEFNRFSDVFKDSPDWNDNIPDELVQSTQAFFDYIYNNDLGVKDILTSKTAFVGQQTASFYDVTIGPFAQGLQQVELGPERAGFFTQVPYLMTYARGNQSYAITRGVHINHEVLCAELPPALAGAALQQGDFTTSRELVEVSTTPCGDGCHDTYINPIGFAFENFDGLGRQRTQDNGVDVDTAGNYPVVGGMLEFKDAADLLTQLADNVMAHECYASHVIGYGLQRSLTTNDKALIDQLATKSLAGASVKDLVVELVTSPAFYTRSGADQ